MMDISYYGMKRRNIFRLREKNLGRDERERRGFIMDRKAIIRKLLYIKYYIAFFLLE